MPTELAAPKKSTVPPLWISDQVQKATRQQLVDAYQPLWQQASEAIEASLPINVTDESQTDEMKKARAARLTIARIRQATEKVRVELKADALALTKAIDGPAKIIKDVCDEHEARLESMEKFADRIAAERRARMVAERSQTLAALGANPALYKLDQMIDAEWRECQIAAADAKRVREEQAAKAEADRKAREEQERIDREKMRAENERLRKEAEEREKAQAEERRKLDAERAAALAKLREAHEAREKLEREAREREEAAKKAEAAKKRAEQKAARAPDAAKIRAWANTIGAIEIPKASTPAGAEAFKAIEHKRGLFVGWITDLAASLDND